MQTRNPNRKVVMSDGGWWNPDAHLKCGALDPDAKFPEPAHVDCKGCHKAIVKLLLARVEKPELTQAPEQIVGNWMDGD